MVVLFLIGGVLAYVTHGPLPAPLVEELSGAYPEIPAFASGLDVSRPPLQTDLKEAGPEVTAGGFRFTPVARFEVDARVLSRRDYRFGRESRFCPVDLALGWGDMAKDEVLEAFRFRQANRFYFWRTRKLPISREKVISQSANMHIVPASKEVFKALKRVREGDRVRIAGFLIHVYYEDGGKWKTSTTRTDSGSGGCEIVLALRLEEGALP